MLFEDRLLSLRVKNFRVFSDFRIQLSKVNIIVTHDNYFANSFGWAVKCLTGEREFDLYDYSFFGEDKVMEIEAKTTWDNHYRIKKYRGSDKKALFPSERIGVYDDISSEGYDEDLIILHSSFFKGKDEKKMMEDIEKLSQIQGQVIAIFEIDADWWFSQKVIDYCLTNYRVIAWDEHEQDWNTVSMRIAARDLIVTKKCSLNEKIELSKKEIRKALLSSKRPTISCSFGKDSMVLLDLVREVYYKLKNQIEEMQEDTEFMASWNELVSEGLVDPLSEPVAPVIIFFNTGVEFPEHLEFAREQMQKLREEGWEVIEKKPKTTFWKVVKESGFPMFGKGVRKRSNPELHRKIEQLGIKTAGNNCCVQLKEKPATEAQKELGVDMIFIGTLAEESNKRRKSFYRTGHLFFAKKEQMYKSIPIAHLSEKDIWDYIETRELPISPIYSIGYYNDDGEFIAYQRNGCWPCAMNIRYKGNNIELLRKTHPRLWEVIMKKGLAKEIMKMKKGWSEEGWNEISDNLLNQMLEVKPCMFDKV